MKRKNLKQLIGNKRENSSSTKFVSVEDELMEFANKATGKGANKSDGEKEHNDSGSNS